MSKTKDVHVKLMDLLDNKMMIYSLILSVSCSICIHMCALLFSIMPVSCILYHVIVCVGLK